MVNPLNEDVIEELAKAKAKADAGNPGTKQPSIFAKFAAMGYSPIPIYKIDGRHAWPLKWSDYCGEQATDAEMAKWARKPDVSVALCGGYRNLLAIDVDSDDPRIKAAVLDALPHCHIARYGSKGLRASWFAVSGASVSPAFTRRTKTASSRWWSSRATGQTSRCHRAGTAKTRSPYVVARC